MEDSEGEHAEDLHIAVADALVDGFWHRAPLGAGPHHELARLIAYTYMEVEEDLSTSFRFVRVEKTSLTAEQLARRVQPREVDSKDCYKYDWVLQTLKGEIVAMPSAEQIEAASIAVAKAKIGARPLPVALVAFLRSETSGANRMEFWSPRDAPTESLWDFYKRRMVSCYL